MTAPHRLDLIIDESRRLGHVETGFRVHARTEAGEWGNVDIAALTFESLAQWLRIGGQSRSIAVAMVVLGHEYADVIKLAIDGN